MVGLQLVREWAKSPECRLTVVGAGSHPPAPGVDYVRLPQEGRDPDLAKLSEFGYAAFCQEFEAATTRFVLDRRDVFDPARTVVVVNDISEGPDFNRLAGAGYKVVSIWHVDVVEYFSRIYLNDLVPPHRWTCAFSQFERWGLARLLPEILRLVFVKQRHAVESSDLMVLPSRQMAETILRCYRGILQNGSKPPLELRTRVLPWGGWREEVDEGKVALEVSRLREHYQLRPDSRVVLTMSRISPEKGIHLLLEALRRLESSPRFRAADICLFVCGETAFMRGESYGRRVRADAERLRRFRVFFPGYLSAFEKQAYFRLADLFVSPSIHESYGLTLVEAMQAGLPVLASDHYGVDEILRPGYGRKVAYWPSARRSRNLASALEEMLADPAALKRMGTAAREAARHMDFADTAAKLLSEALGLIPEGVAK
jgi:glycosyltransferase involved in cell wall biosynthesis